MKYIVASFLLIIFCIFCIIDMLLITIWDFKFPNNTRRIEITLKLFPNKFVFFMDETIIHTKFK